MAKSNIDMAALLGSYTDKSLEEHTKKESSILDTSVQNSAVSAVKKTTACVSLTDMDKRRLTKLAKEHGLTLSGLFLVAANEYVENHKWELR